MNLMKLPDLMISGLLEFIIIIQFATFSGSARTWLAPSEIDSEVAEFSTSATLLEISEGNI